MSNRIRDVRRARKLTLQQVACACEPPTTPQTIGRLETGKRNVSLAWLERLAAALDTEVGELLVARNETGMPVVATLDREGARGPARETIAIVPHAAPGMMAVSVSEGLGDYRAGDEIWCERIAPDAFSSALNRDVLAPRPSGRFLFGRLLGREDGRLHILPAGVGQRQMVIADPEWIGIAKRLIRGL